MASIDMGAATVISSEHFMVKGMFINPLTYCAYCCSYLYHNFSICDPAFENTAFGHKYTPPHNISYLSIGIEDVTGPAKIGHVGTNYSPSHNRLYQGTGITYLHSVTCIIKPTKSLIIGENCIITA